jgi:hypothetical protein
MSNDEERIQQDIESGRIPGGDGLDVKAYQEVFRALAKEPRYQISPRFAENVVARVAEKQQAKQSRDYLWFGAGIFLLILTAVVTVMVVGFKPDFGFLSSMSDYKGLAVFGILFITFLNWLDKRVIRGRQVQY